VTVGGERLTDLRGVFSGAAVLRTALPSECSKNPYLNCGYIEMVLPKSVLTLFDIRDNPQEIRRLNLTVYSQLDGYGRGVARVYAAVDGKKASFSITSTGGGDNDPKRLTLEREFGDGTGDIIQIKGTKKDKDILKAFKKLVELHRRKMQAIDKNLLCRTCSAKINGLPGAVV
jgi:hypothetical protein